MVNVIDENFKSNILKDITNIKKIMSTHDDDIKYFDAQIEELKQRIAAKPQPNPEPPQIQRP